MNYRDAQKQILDELVKKSWAGDNPASSVAFNSDFSKDDRLCLTFLTFLPDRKKEKIVSLIDRLKAPMKDHYLYPPESLHVTIQNVRSVSEKPNFTTDDIKIARETFARTLNEFEQEKLSLQFELKGLLLLPGSLSIVAYADEHYPEFILRLRKNLSLAGVEDNKKYISDKIVFGNCTIARFSRELDQNLIDLINSENRFEAGFFNTQSIHLVTTNAVCHPLYTKVRETFELKSTENPAQ